MHKLRCLFITFFFTSASLVTIPAASAQDDSFIASQQAECTKNTAMEWNSAMNKCVGKVAAREDRHEAQACNQIADIPQREACHIALAEKNTGLSSDPDTLYKGSNGALMMNAAYTIVSVINFTGKGGIKSSCTSKKVFAVAAIAGLATDILLKMQAKKKVKELTDKYKLEKEMAANTAQVKALEYLKEEQETVAKIAGQEKTRNMLLVVGYGAAGAIALYEIATGRASSPDCSAPSKSADGAKPATPAAPAAGTPAPAASALSSVTNIIGNSKGILVMSAIGAVYSGMLMSAAAKQEEESKANAKKVEKMIKSFNDSFQAFCPNGREKLEEPKCYCYLDSGAKNTNRSNSQICQQLWQKSEYSLDSVAGNYNGAAQKVDPVGCVAVNGQFDERCQCKKFIDAKGANACMKGTNITIPAGLGANFGEYSGINTVASVSTNLGNGNSILDSLGNTLNNAAIKAKSTREQLLSKLAPVLSKENLAIAKMDEKTVGKYARAVLGDRAMNSMAASMPSSAMGIAASRSDNEKIANLLKEAELKAGLDLTATGGKGLTNKGTKKEMEFNFMADNAGGAGPGGQVVQGFEEKTYKYKNSDIVPDENASLFEIISNRYVQSGLRRLFDEEL